MGLNHDPTCRINSSRSIVSPRQVSVISGAGRWSEARRWSDTSRRRRRLRLGRRGWNGPVPLPWMLLVLVVLVSFLSPAHAVFHSFDNCLPESTQNSNPLQLQFIPSNVSVVLDSLDPLHTLNITVYGNVSGLTDTSAPYPPPDDPGWEDPNNTIGKIKDISLSNNKFSTLVTKINVLTFTPYDHASRFCESVVQGECPLGPAFYANSSDPSELRAFSIEHDLLSSFRFSTLSSQMVILSGDAGASQLGCISLDITPDLGSSLKSTLTYVPLVILILVGFATVMAAIYSPWGTTDPFRWTNNYGRDEDVLRLVTPGFGDCLQYIQFVVLTGGLSLNYPGYYQPVVSQAAWSSLMFNQSFLNPGHERNPISDGVYIVDTNGTYGLDQLGQLVGVDSSRDLWPGMIIWLLAVVASVTLLIQLAFAFRRVYREVANVPEEDLRAKNLPFTTGNVIRIVFNYLFLPAISLSFFQLVIAKSSPAYSVALAAVVILIFIVFSLWMVRVIATTRPKSYLFDDLSTVLLYGPLYNTFCDDAAAFAVVPIFISFGRGVAIGALQPSGIAQIVLLAICEVVNVLTLVAFRPFPEPTSMNLYHSCFSIIRFLTILLSVTFVPSLRVSESARGWIGYVVLLLHAIVLVFGFFLNALQTLIEVVARLAGAGGYEGGATRGGLVKVLGMRQLARRLPRQAVGRQSMGSEAAMLAQVDERVSSQFEGSRPRSFSGSSAFVLNRAGASDGRGSAVFESGSARGTHSRANSSGMYTPTTGGPHPFAGYQTTGSNSPKSATAFSQPHDPYYRPPRPRRKTTDTVGSSHRRRPSFIRGSRSNADNGEDDLGDGPSGSTPTPAYIPAPKDELDYDEPRQPRKDYAVREVDFYYRVRGPPLSQSGTRKLKTGPADPTGPVSSATGWFRNFFRGKTKDKAKGFEVVRSARAPPPGLFPEGDYNEPYHDEPDPERRVSETDAPYHDSEEDNQHSDRPILPEINHVGGMELPSRMNSSNSQRPSVPRRSSKRQSSPGSADEAPHSLSVVTEAISGNPRRDHPGSSVSRSASGTGRLPFSATSSPSRDRGLSIASTTASNASSHHQAKDGSVNPRVERPSSMGYVAQYRARDNIHQASPDEPSFTGSTAELVDEPLHTDRR